MIHFITSPQTTGYAITAFLSEYAQELACDVKLLDWGDLLRTKEWPTASAWIFVAAERENRSELLEVEGRLLHAGQRVFNAPSRTLRRYALLSRLWSAGINSFDVHPTDLGAGRSWRYPIFIRHRDEHDGSLTDPLENADEAAAEFIAAPHLMSQHTMAVELVDVRSRDLLYRKYSIMRIGDRYIPRHVLFSEHWMVKYPDVVDDRLAEEELQFVANVVVPHAVRQAFKIAGIEYGRIDYGVDADGQVQVWEINQSPVLVPCRRELDSRRLISQCASAGMIVRALKELR